MLVIVDCCRISCYSVFCKPSYSGATVVGSDIDGDGLIGNDPSCRTSKNANFRRKGNVPSQLDKCTLDNFKHYKLQERVLDLFGASVLEWLPSADESAQGASRGTMQEKYPKVHTHLNGKHSAMLACQYYDVCCRSEALFVCFLFFHLVSCHCC
jgi:hypothetical protein